MSSRPAEYYVYAIAGGETLDLINKLKADAENSKQELEKLAQGYGASLSFYFNQAVFSFSSANPYTFQGTLPEGWKVKETRGGFVFSPDEQTDKGSAIKSDISNASQGLNIAYHFNEVCAANSGSCRGMDNFTFEKVGDKFIVKCPEDPAQTGEYLIPPDSTPISVSDYFKMKEAAGLVPQKSVKTFKYGLSR